MLRRHSTASNASTPYQKIGRYPFYAIVGMATDDYLGDWRRNSLILAALTGMVILTVIFATWALYRASLRQANQTRVHAALQELAATDGLTGVANRRCFDETLEREWLRTRREASPLSLLMLDVDHFKHYNDTYGHQRGDECLKLIAAVMLEETQRSTDLVARYGGEEFAVVLPGTSAEGAATVAERIRARVEGLGVPHAGLHGSTLVTVSLGAATAIASPERDLAQLLAAADTALYRAKHKGRNSVVTVWAGSLEVA